MFFTAGLLVTSFAAGVLAQGMSLSPGCQTAMSDIAASPAGQCMGLSQLMVIAATPQGQSIIKPFSDWLDFTCPQPTCDDATIHAAMTNVTTGCATDFHIPEEVKLQVVDYTVLFYQVVLKALCIKDASADNGYCSVQTFQALESTSGTPLSMPDLMTGTAFSAVENMPTNNLCTTCNKMMYQAVWPKIPEATRISTDDMINQKCGTNFATDPPASSVKQSASGSGSASGALSLNSGLVGAFTSGLVAVAGVVALGL